MKSLSDENVYKEITPKVSQVKFTNFRVFDKETIFDFRREGKEISDFVCIYGKNGMGKSSFFDGIEWLFSGTINRLEKEMRNDIKFFKGDILKNKNISEEKFKIEMELSNNELLCREYKKRKDSGNDYKKGRFKGKQEYIEKHDKLVLPHSKIDGFIYATNPNAKYEQWGDFWDPTKTERKRFDSIFKVKKECENILNNKIKEKEEKQKELDKSILKEKDINEINYIIEKYNELNKVKKINKIEYKDNKLIMFKRDELIKLKEIDLKEIDIKSIERGRYNTLYENYNDFILNKNKLEEIEKEINIIKVKNESYKIKMNLNKEKAMLEKYSLDINEKTLKLQEIKLKGIDWFNKILEYKEMVSSYKDLNNIVQIKHKSILEYSKNINLLKKENELLDEKINTYKTIIRNIEDNIKDKYIKLISDKKNYGKLEIEIHDITKQISDMNEKIIKLKQGIFDLENEDLIIRNKTTIDEIKYILDDELYEKYDNEIKIINNLIFETEKRYNNNNEIYIENKTKSEFMLNLKSEFEKYIIENELKDCPLCNTKFGDLEKLVKNINLYNTQKTEDIIIKLLEDDRKLLKQYDFKKVKVFKCINNDINKLLNIGYSELKQLNTKYEILNTKNINLKLNIDKNEDIISSFINKYGLIKDKNTQSNTYLDNIINTINTNVTQLQNLVVEKEKEIKIATLEYENLKLEVYNLEKKINYINDIYINIVSENSSLYKFIIDEKIDCFDDVEKKEEINKIELIRIEDKIKNIELQLNNISDEINIDENIKKMNDINLNKEKYINFINEYNQNLKSLNLTPNIEIIYNKRINNEKIINEINQKLELLNKLISNNTLELYNKKIEELTLELEKINSEITRYQDGLEEILKIFNLVKTNIENRIMNKFSGMTIDSVYKKIEPHKIYTKLKYEVSFNDKEMPELYIKGEDQLNKIDVLPQLFYSSAQLNTVALSIFLGEAVSNQNFKLKTLFIDDPIGHFDDINILGFVDLLRTMVSKYGWQIIISTHDEVLFNILNKKISSKFYKSKFIKFNSPGNIETIE